MVSNSKDIVNAIISDAHQLMNNFGEYVQAVKEIEEESSAKDNLWDRFLNVLAGNIPFNQTPEERVMMRRWLAACRERRFINIEIMNTNKVGNWKISNFKFDIKKDREHKLKSILQLIKL